MGTLTFNLYEGMASLKLAEAMHIAPDLKAPIEAYRLIGMTDAEIVEHIAKIIMQLEAEKETKQ